MFEFSILLDLHIDCTLKFIKQDSDIIIKYGLIFIKKLFWFFQIPINSFLYMFIIWINFFYDFLYFFILLFKSWSCCVIPTIIIKIIWFSSWVVKFCSLIIEALGVIACRIIGTNSVYTYWLLNCFYFNSTRINIAFFTSISWQFKWIFNRQNPFFKFIYNTVVDIIFLCSKVWNINNR